MLLFLIPKHVIPAKLHPFNFLCILLKGLCNAVNGCKNAYEQMSTYAKVKKFTYVTTLGHTQYWLHIG
jgi:hypothetical protein